ncbi:MULTISPECIES: DNA polymerase III subunit gamma and tau [Paenarthrobacter]|uniref:DNA polymerase III subunit gamma and tau n=1 Tax=Paenarthrobacter TaxID=1742992 RepID=UPI00076C95CE|nr:DNA polymerase III subunit gamma and tau [Paenarthrobacter ureafaciens]KUR64867.1 ATPase AAA [Arthrobacter sp. ATCC 21022]RWW95509.1 DNA polymerase III subunit gamma and tau [Paenarthrobacter ureafaciens]
MTVTTALYRRYRPDSFADVIGQEHVTEPLMTALRKNRVNHAYLFSGPRGCGKTTSARILARCLNCAEGPTDTPCGKCPSCIELARGGSGSLDVIEIDAASHGGVDDARDLRERATFAPVRDRYKIFIIDEAHMVTSAGFNALLKIVEEPPEHIKFIFATTEPDKVIGTIRSRTHHYPFRLVPPEPLIKYLELLCHQENVPVAPGVLSLVIRAGGGSVRDSLSVLDQLMAGAGPNGLDYELAVALLGYTHASLLDDVVDAVAAADSATVFRAVDRVIQTGHDPRRFVEDLLERFRDLIIVQAMPESAQSILRGMPEDQIARMRNQATNLGAAELSRAADVTNTALTEMTGATSPRLHLELLCARILLPSAEQTERGIAARIDRVERRLNYAGDAGIPAAASASPQAGAAPVAGSQAQQAPAAQPVAPAAQQTAPAVPAATAPMTPQQPAERPVEHQTATAPAAPTAPVAPATAPAQDHQRREPQHPASEARTSLTAPRVSTNDWPVEDRSVSGRPTGPAEGQQAPVQTPATQQNPAAPTGQAAPAAQSPAAQQNQPYPSPASQPAPATRSAPASQSAPAPEARPAAIPSAPTPSGGDVETLRRAWPDVLQTLAKIKRSTWALVEPNAQVAQYDAQVLTLAFTTSGLAGAFGRADHAENLRQAIHKTIGIDCQIVAVAGANSSASSEPNPKARTSRDTPATNAQEPVSGAQGAGNTVSDGAAHLASGSDTAPLAPAPVAAAPTPVAATPAPVAATPAPAPAAATAVDAAWGIAPASRPEQESSAGKDPAQDAPRKAPAQETPAPEPAAPEPVSTDHTASTSESSARSTENAEAPSWPAASPVDRESVWLTGPKTPEEPPAGPQATPQAGPRASVPDTAGDYSYPDDDWGPPLDEDAPPLEEEPPADWEPTPRYEAPAAPAQAQADARPRTPSRPQASPQPTQATKPPNATETPSRPDPAQDPWSRAVEHAPGTWVVGTESNVGGKAKANGNSSDHQAAQPSQNESAPQYEPAAAQIPATAQAPTAGTPDIGSETAEPSTYGQPTSAGNNGSSGWDVAPPSEWPGTGATQTQQKAPAWPLSSLEPQEAHGSVATLEGDAPSGGPAVKQSLYQRLTNSPEAQRGRVQAPAHPQAQPTSVAEDIPSPEDETIEESRVFGRAAVERILGGKLIEERSLDGSPLHMR